VIFPVSLLIAEQDILQGCGSSAPEPELRG